jgi:hypothetical protein
MGQVRGQATLRGLLACPASQRAVREVPAAWSCCRQLSEMCDSAIVAAPMAFPPPLAMVRGRRCLYKPVDYQTWGRVGWGREWCAVWI